MSGPQFRGDSLIVPTHKVHLAVLCMLSGGLACAQTGLISTIAGTGSVGPLGDGGAATSATLYGPAGLAVDSNGNLFIADTNNSRIRKVSGGIITTVVGGGSGADGLPALEAQLFNPCDVKVDSAGNIYISESCVVASSGSGGGGGGAVMNRVRRVDAATGIIRTIAGGISAGFSGDGGPPGSASQLNTPGGLAIDASGSVYIADSGNNRVRRIDGATGIISTVAGNGTAAFAGDGGLATAASLNYPSAVAVDAAGTLYIADAGNNRIRRVDAGTGIITTLAGTGSTSYNGDGAAATSANVGIPSALQVNGAGNLLLADLLNNRLRLVDTSTGLIWTVAGNGPVPPPCCGGGDGGPAALAALNGPAGIALSPMGPLFISEHAGQRVRQIALQNPLVNTALNLTASGASVPSGSPLTLTAVLSVMNGSAANITASVHFVEAGFAIGSAPLVNGSASFTTTSLQQGAHSITGQYFGDSVFSPSISLPVTVTITAPQSSVALAANPSPAVNGQPIALTATVTPSSATGTVNFFNGTTSIGTANISNGTATLAGVALMTGSYSLTAQYSGNISLPSSTSPAITLTVKEISSVTLTSSVNPSTPGQAVTFTATVWPSTAGGSVQFLDNGSVIGTYFFMSGPATFSISTLTSGTHSITASYGGDANNTSATSAALTQTVLFSSSVVVTSSQNPSLVGSPVTFTASVTPGNATGTVQFVDGTTVLGTGTLAGGSASFTTSTLAQGTHYSITAVYSGDASNAGSTSAALLQTVNKVGSTTTLSASPAPSTWGQSVTLTATVTPASATGTVQFFNGSASLGSATIASGQAQLATTALPVGTDSLTATYSGDANTLTSTSAAIQQTVNKVVSATTLSASPAPSTWGQSVTLTATVTPAGATGNVQFFSGSTSLGSATITSGQAQLATTALPVGTDSLTATYGGDANTAVSTSAAVSQTVNKVASTTTLSASPSPSNWGQSVTLTATVTPAGASGSVQFFNGSTSLGSATLTSGQAQLTTTALPVGTDSLTAIYGGDANTLTSTSAAIQQTVNRVVSTTALSASPAPSTWGQSVTLAATVTPAGATGTVQFFNGSTSLGSATLASGQAQLATTSLPAGTDSLTATYSGDANTAVSTSAAVSQTVNKAVSTTTLSASPGPSTWGQSVTLTASVTPAGATGTVQFFNGSTSLGSATITSGLAQLATTALPVGTNSLTATYSGDVNTAGSTSSAVSQTVNKIISTTTLSASPAPSTWGQSVTLTVTVAPAGATGTVQFFNGLTSLGSAALTSGQAQLATTALPVGTDSLTAAYSGDANTAGSTSAAVSQTVNQASTATSLTSSLNPSTFGASVTLTASVAPSNATGAVQFFNGSTLLGSATLSGGQAQFTTTALPVGTDSIAATYNGDASNTASTSAVLQQNVNRAISTTSLALAGSNPSPYGSSVTLTAAVSPSSATGTVQFFNGATSLGSVNVSNGQAQFTTTTLPVGTASLSATYSGDTNNSGSTSSAIQLTVNKASTTATLMASPSTSTVGQAVTLTTTVTPSSATGSVQFLNGSTVLGTANVSGGQAQFTTTALPAGTNSLTAAYGGDANYLNATSAAITQTVTKTATATTVTSSPNPSISGGSVTFGAAVSPPAATGTVQFLDGATVLGTGTLANGTASFATSTLTQGTHSITAVYGGDAANAGSTSAVLSQSVKLYAGLTMGISPSPAVVGQTVTITANMNTAATGTVTFTDGSTVLATVPVSSGVASYSTSSLTAGTHALGISYGGDATYVTSSASFNETVLVASSVALHSNANPATVGQSITFTAVVTPTSATGTVQFFDGAALIATAPAVTGVATFSTASFAKGSHSVSATYSGDSTNSQAFSAPLTQIVRVVTSISLASSVNPSTVGQPVSFSASLTPSTATGTIQFLDGSTVLSTVNVNSGSAVFATSQLGAGTHSITAFYSGDNSDTAVTSAVLTQTVNVPPPAAPSNLVAAAAGSSQINLTWTASSTSGVTYDVYASTSSGFTPSASNRIASGVASTTYSNTGLSPSTKHYYRVTAVNAGGESAATNQASATTAAALACHVGYSVTNQWNVGFGGAITIKNTGTTPINSWTLTWTWPGNQHVTQSWNANYTQSGANVTFTNMSYNATIAPGATLSGVGFNASYSGSNPSPTAFSVNGTLCH